MDAVSALLCAVQVQPQASVRLASHLHSPGLNWGQGCRGVCGLEETSSEAETHRRLSY